MNDSLKTIIVFISIFLQFANGTRASEEFKPDLELLRKLAEMSYADAVKELEKVSDQNKYEYSYLLASDQLMHKNNAKTAIQFCEYALGISDEAGLPKGRIYLLQAYIYSSLNQRVETIADLENASKCFKEENNPELLKQCLSWLGSEYYDYGYFEKSEQSYEDLIKMCSDPNDEGRRAQALFDISEVYSRCLKMDKAKDAAEQAKTIFIKEDNQKGVADCLKLLGNVWLAKNETEKAKESYLQAIKAYKNTNDSHGQGNCNFNLGLLSIKLKQYPEAIDYLNQANYFYTAAGSITGSGIAQMEIGRAYCLQGLYEKAESALKQAETFLTGQSQYRLAQVKEYLGDLERARNNKKGSLGYYKSSADLFREVNLKKDVARIGRKILKMNEK